MSGAEVVAVYPNKIKIAVHEIADLGEGVPVEVGSYLRVYDSNASSIIAVIENYSIEARGADSPDREREKVYLIEAVPLGFIGADDKFQRGGGGIAIPPKEVMVASHSEIQKIYDALGTDIRRFHFAQLSQDAKVAVPVDGDKFFNRHIAIVGSTGSGKSHAMARIIQAATEIRDPKRSQYSLNNSHVVIFDIHSEYSSAFPEANYLSVDSLMLPYWLLNSEELQTLFIESVEEQSHNQIATLKRGITDNRKKHYRGPKEKRDLIHYDSPLFFDIGEVIEYIQSKNDEMIEGANGKLVNGPLKGKLVNFLTRLENKYTDRRLDFLLGEKVKQTTLEEVLRQFTGYRKGQTSNVTIIDLSGVPFEVLSISVSLISRLLFDYAFYYKKTHEEGRAETPILVVYEEAHKYVPRSDLSRFSASRAAIERIAKEGRKYGITAAIVSQRPAEISETIFSQCSNFLAMRLTNPEDQRYVRRLIPDSLGPLTDSLPMLSSGEALLLGDAAVMPSVVKLREAEPAPSSSDICYMQEWIRPWHDVLFSPLLKDWEK
ncbi:ATP-binding protein [Streptomyces sp. NPDC058305]|uniref:ATP-binding protein n=1 Tax=Streptomyces sp. NPDC058305 TaxID=3346438 RepID=UPI0036E57841